MFNKELVLVVGSEGQTNVISKMLKINKLIYNIISEMFTSSVFHICTGSMNM